MQTPDTKPGLYYVSVKRQNGDAVMLLGPFENDHAGALAMVDAAQKLACEIDPRGHFYAYGTARKEAGEPVEIGILNKYFTADLRALFSNAA